MIIKRFFDIQYFRQNNVNEKESFLNFLVEKKMLFSVENLKIINDNNKAPLYFFDYNLINIPNNFYKSDKNYSQYIVVQEFLKEKSLEFIVKHEIGHCNHHQFLSLDFNQYTENFEYITIKPQSNYIKTKTSLDQLLNRSFLKSNPVDDFIQMNFTESYADGYAGLCCYLQDKNASIFDDIYNFRLRNLNNLKRNIGFEPKINNQNILEVHTGGFATSSYSNYTTSAYIKKNIVKKFDFKNLESMPINILHNLIQIEVLDSLQETLKKEISQNKLFNNDFYKYLEEKKMPIDLFFLKFNDALKDYRNNTLLSIAHMKCLENNKDGIKMLINFHSKNNGFIPFKSSNNLFTLSEEKQIFDEIDRLKKNKKLELNFEKFTKFIVSDFLLPKKSFLVFISNLENNININLKEKELSKILGEEFINSLLNYNKKNLYFSKTSLPSLKNYNKNELLELLTESLNEKEKERFIKSINKENIIDISTPHLSSNKVQISNNENNILYNDWKNKYLCKIDKIIDQIGLNNKKSLGKNNII